MMSNKVIHTSVIQPGIAACHHADSWCSRPPPPSTTLKTYALSICAGQGVLENVQLRPGALDEMQLPVAISEGRVGRLRLKASPSLLSQPAA